jgi:signal transduction histidine kinase
VGTARSRTATAPGLPPAGAGSPAAAGRLATELIAAELDRGRLAESVHDGLLQNLIAARYLADLACDDSSPEPLREVRAALQAAIVDARRLLGRLQPRTMSHSGLSGGLAALVAAVRAAHPEVEVDLTTPEETGSLPPVAAITAYRMVQSAVYDALLRGARRIEVAVRVDGPRLSVLLGWKGATREPGEEVRRWCERVTALGGVTSTLPTGLSVTLPLSEPEPARPDGEPVLPIPRLERLP